MILKTLYREHHKLSLGDLELRLIPGIPQMHLVGLPDTRLKEVGIKIKTALRSAGLRWPKGQQVVVNFRSPAKRSSSSGAELAIVAGILALTDQLPGGLEARLADSVWFGEVSLEGQICAPFDFARALSAVRDEELITGKVTGHVGEGTWHEWAHLSEQEANRRESCVNWGQHWVRPEVSGLTFSEPVSELLALVAHSRLNVLLAGPQGSGKSTFTQVLPSLLEAPDPELFKERVRLFGQSALSENWYAVQSPHHSVTPQAMIGGGLPIQPGVITRAHQGVLVMDEFLEFHPVVLESLREPLENGEIHLARYGDEAVLPAKFHLLATTNLCPCGKMEPGYKNGCTRSASHCRSVVNRLSGPLLDRFDLLVFTDNWREGEGQSWQDVLERVSAARKFAHHIESRRFEPACVPPEFESMGMNHRRRQSLLRVARGLADLRKLERIGSPEWHRADELVCKPIVQLGQLFG